MYGDAASGTSTADKACQPYSPNFLMGQFGMWQLVEPSVAPALGLPPNPLDAAKAAAAAALTNSTTGTNGTATGAGYLASGTLGEKVWATGDNGSYIAFSATDLSNVKTMIIVFDPESYTSSWAKILLSFNSSTGKFAGYFDSYSSSTVVNVSNYSGLSASTLVNGNTVSSNSAARNAIEQYKFNTLVWRNYDLSGASTLFFRSGAGQNNDNLEIRAILTWTVSLTDTEIAAVHNRFPSVATWDGP